MERLIKQLTWVNNWFCDKIMGYPIHPLSNVGVAGQYLNQLTSDNISQRYFSGT